VQASINEALTTSAVYWMISILVGGVVIGLTVYQRRWSLILIVTVALLAFHPRWTFPTSYEPDCTFVNIEASQLVLAILILILGYQTIGRRYISRTVAIVIFVLGTVMAFDVLYIWYVNSNFAQCETLILKSIPSPNGNKAIVIFGKECGATVGFNTQISVALTRGAFSSEKNPPFLVVSTKSDVAARWLGETAIEVIVPQGVKVFKNEQNVDGINVEYK
jgi:hypothetical protein